MHIKRMMNIIIEKGNIEDMHFLGEVSVDAIYELKHTNPMWYNNIEIKMHKRAYGHHLTEEQVKSITAYFENKDGSTGEHWDYDTVMSVYKSKQMKCNFPDFYFILNYVYAKHWQQTFTTDIYIELAKDTMKHESILDIYYRVVRVNISK